MVSLEALEPGDLATLRMRTIRRDSYRCRVSDAAGYACDAPATRLGVDPKLGLVAACKRHEHHG